jgi:hypothetical protein
MVLSVTLFTSRVVSSGGYPRENPVADPTQLRRMKEEGIGAWNVWLQLSENIHVDLSGADLHKANLRWAILSEGDLSEANFREAGADLHGANLGWAVLNEPTSAGPTFTGPTSTGSTSLALTSVGPTLPGPDLARPISAEPISARQISEEPISARQISGEPISPGPTSARPT